MEFSKPLLLAADVGGTKTYLALFDEKKVDEPLFLESFASRDFPDLKSLVISYLKKIGKEKKIKRAAFAIAGPCKNQEVKVTNLPWQVSAKQLKEALGFDVVLLNDLEASGWGIELLSKESLHVLNVGEKGAGNRVILSPGTGLGEAICFFDGKNYYPMATEGGHSDFAPQSEIEIELFRYLQGIFGHVSYERICSGMGIKLLYDFFSQVKKKKGEFNPEEKEFSEKIIESALSKKSEIAVSVLDLFVKILGQEMGNLALKAYALGGIYLGGGIPAKILPKLKEPFFIESFISKGRFGALLKSIPIYVILDSTSSLKGAARFLMQTKL